MKFCPPNETVTDLWVNHGLSHCSLETLSTSAAFGFLLVFGVVEWIVYGKYSTPVVSYARHVSWMFVLQLALVGAVLPILDVTRFTLEAVAIGEKVVYGYMVLAAVMTWTMWIFNLGLIFLERNYMLPSTPTQGHGVILLIFWTVAFVKENLTFFNLKSDTWWFKLSSASDKIEFGLFIVRYIGVFTVFVLGLKAPGIPKVHDYNDGVNRRSDPERNEPLLGESAEEPTFVTHEGSTFSNMWFKLRTLLPFIWPKKDCVLQMQVIICLVLLGLGRVANVYVPIYYKLIVDSMTPNQSSVPLTYRWDYVLVYVGIKFLQGGGTGAMGLLNNLRTFLWIKVQQYTTREIQVKFFAHLHGLSLRWHLGRKTGEVLRVMDRGTNSINTLLSYIVFSIAPTIADIVIAVLYFSTAFNAWFGLIVFVTMFLYLAATIAVTEWRTKYRRSMNQTDNDQRAISVDSILNFETVKYYGAENYETERYRNSIVNYQVEEWKSSASLNILNTIQNIIISGGLLVGSLLCVQLVVVQKSLTVGDYVLFATYIMQLYTPLNWFGTYYRMIQQNFIDMENMLDLLKEKREVKDFSFATDLNIKDGQIEFRDVDFYYNSERPILKKISFLVPPGKTCAIVGPSGGGKSTIIRLLFRFYDIQNGEILLDDQNIKYVTQASVRKAIGVVPQDTVLFNDTIKYNIKYGRLSATDEEIEEAAKYADIHEKIITFPDSYKTVVGERGLKLSGGEKQRVAIARTMLKAPAFILLDEATSALDTQTERNIQAALNSICTNKTTVIVAHRLSTIIHADQILVLSDGEIIERGRHEELLEKGGTYAAMWEQQLRSDNANKQITEDESFNAEEERETRQP